MKRILFGLIFLGVASGAIYVGMHKAMTSDPGYLIGVVGGEIGNTYELHVVVPFLMTRRDPPKLDPRTGKSQNWNDWIEEHFELRDDANQRVTFRKSDFTRLVPAAKVGTPNFYLQGQVQVDVPYTFDYLPYGIASENRYRHEFIIPPEGMPFARPAFKPVDSANP